MHIIDLRSDTVTKPTPAMRQAMAEAEVGDDVLGDDPTVIRLQEMTADRLGKEAGLFVASGTMGNLVSLLVHCARGEEVILGDQAHTYYYEQGGMAALGGIQPRVVVNQPDGTLRLEDVRHAIRDDNVHYPRTRLITVENTHNRCSGSALTAEYMHQLGALAREHGLRLHLDGARLFNAAAALGVGVKELVSDCDSVMVCLSKGLAAPVGSVVCGDAAFIREARRARKIVGGGMRQVGVIAAAGIVALEQMVDRLADDHANARALADGLAEMPQVAVEPMALRTNMVYFRLLAGHIDSKLLAERLAERGIWIMPLEPRKVRLVTHYQVTAEDVGQVLAAFRAVLNG